MNCGGVEQNLDLFRFTFRNATHFRSQFWFFDLNLLNYSLFFVLIVNLLYFTGGGGAWG